MNELHQLCITVKSKWLGKTFTPDSTMNKQVLRGLLCVSVHLTMPPSMFLLQSAVVEAGLCLARCSICHDGAALVIL